jgi:hypothetical protein
MTEKEYIPKGLAQLRLVSVLSAQAQAVSEPHFKEHTDELRFLGMALTVLTKYSLATGHVMGVCTFRSTDRQSFNR